MSKVFIEESTLTNIANAIRGKDGTTDLISPLDMPSKITNLPTGGGNIEVEPIVLSENCKYACAGTMASTYIDLFGDTVSTNGITDASNMFENYASTKIPFAINFKNSAYNVMTSMFNNAEKLEELPAINNAYPGDIARMFFGCRYLKSIPEGFGDDWNWSRIQSYIYGNMSYLFSYCNSLRYIPESFLNKLIGSQTSSSYSPYYSGFMQCYALDEIKGLAVCTGGNNSNCFSNCFAMCHRLKAFTFAVNEDGTPKTAKWGNQLIDLSAAGHGYSNSPTVIYNSGITADKQIKDDATYAALKNDPDCWVAAGHLQYSRYNHDSAVETINSLPDTTAYASTNVIKFKGAAGSATDGGAINTLTEEEIAVATAKGWTVSLA